MWILSDFIAKLHIIYYINTNILAIEDILDRNPNLRSTCTCTNDSLLNNSDNTTTCFGVNSEWETFLGLQRPNAFGWRRRCIERGFRISTISFMNLNHCRNPRLTLFITFSIMMERGMKRNQPMGSDDAF